MMPLGHGELQLAMELHGRGAGAFSHRSVGPDVHKVARGLLGPYGLRGLGTTSTISFGPVLLVVFGLYTTRPWTRGAGASSYYCLGPDASQGRLRDPRGPAALRDHSAMDPWSWRSSCCSGVLAHHKAGSEILNGQLHFEASAVAAP